MIKEKDYKKILHDFRMEHNLSQEALSKLLGVSWGTVSRWLRGRYYPSVLAQQKIDKLFKKYEYVVKEE